MTHGVHQPQRPVQTYGERAERACHAARDARIFQARTMLPDPNPPRLPRQSVSVVATAIGLAALLVSGGSGCKKGTVAPTAKATTPPVIDTAARLVDAQDEVARTELALTKRFLELDKRRLRLAKSTPAEVEAYNRDAATYSADLEALRRRHEAVKQMQIADSARRQAAPDDEQRAQACLIRLRAAININDWQSQVVAMEQALAQFRNTQAFAQISAVARPRLEAMTSAELERALAKPAGSAPLTVPVSASASTSEASALVQQLRSIINQPVQPEPKSGERVGTYNFHGGGAPLDYANVTREELLRERMTFQQPQIEARDHPGVYYRSEDTEFNIRLKWYNAYPTRPTKRLTDIEYDRIIDLSRRIAAAQKSPVTTSQSGAAPSAPSYSSSGQVSAEELWPRIATLKRKWPR